MSRPHLAKRLNAFDATLIVMGGIIASGIFMNPSVVAERLHSTGLILFAWILGGIIALIGAFVFAELASRRPDVGGMYGYLRDAYHPALAFMSGWTALLVTQSGAIAAVAVTFATYAHLWIALDVPVLAVIAIVATGLINCFGVRESVATQNTLMLMKAGAIALIVAAGFFGPVAPMHHAAAPPASLGALAALAALGAALIPVFYSYDGWQTAPFLDGEMKHSQRALPVGLVLGVIGVVILYIAVTLGGLRMLGADGLAATSTPATDMVRLVIGRAGEGIVAAFIALSTLGYIQNATLCVPRLYYRMAQDGLFFKQLAYLHPKAQTPVVAITLQCVVASAIVGWGNYQRILNYVTPMDFLYMVLAAVAIWIFRRRDTADRTPAIRIPGHPWSTIFFAGVCAAFVVNAYLAFPRDSVIGLVIFLSGAPLYLLWRGHSRRIMRSIGSTTTIAVVLIASLCCNMRGAQAAGPPTIDDALKQIETYAPQALQEQGAPGMSVAITDRTHTLRILTLGYANLDAKTPVTASTRFPVGSITKGMTALGLMEARDEGRFDPSRPVPAYLPWFSIHSGGKTIYAHQLLSHTGGTPDDFSISPGYMYSVAALRNAHTIFPPGTSWSYSNDGLATTGAILETLDRRPWAQSLQTRVFDALGMTHSSAIFTPQTLDDAALGYVFDDSNAVTPPNPRLIASVPGDFVDPAGSVISTPEDMAKYMRLILNAGTNDAGKRILSQSSYALWTTPDSNNGKLAGETSPELEEAPLLYQHYAFGLAVHAENGDTIVGHTGGIAGYSACMENDVTRGFGVIAMSNLVEAPLHPCAIVLYAIRVLQAQSAGRPLPPIPIPQGNYLQRTAVKNAADYAGTYTAPDGSALTITANGDTLSLQTAQGPKTLYPRGGDTFYVDDPRFTALGLTFLRNKAGKPDEVVSASQWFASAAYSGPRTFSYPRAWDALTGRYESLGVWGIASASRVYVLKGKLVLDGAPLLRQPDGSFKAGTATVHFDTPAAGKMQRMRVDDFDLYRIDLP